MKIGIENDFWTAEYYEATVVSANDYYPFGSAMAGRKYNQGTYRYGFNGKEEDKEWGSQIIQDYGFRIYNPTIGKFLSVDPLAPDYPWYTPYQFAGNMPIAAIDLDGLEPWWSFDKWKPLSKGAFWAIAGPYKSRLQNKYRGNKAKRDLINKMFPKAMGNAMEAAVLSALGYKHNYEPVGPNKHAKKGYSIPDAIRDGYVTNIFDEIYYTRDMIEVKTVLTKDEMVVYAERAKKQIDDYAAEIVTSASPYKDQLMSDGVIYLITNANIEIDPEIIQVASKRNIAIFHSETVINEEGKVAVTDPVWLNKEDIDVSKHLIKSKDLLESSMGYLLLNDNGISEKTLEEYIEKEVKIVEKAAKNKK
jgi:RHS repeat-associated protein